MIRVTRAQVVAFRVAALHLDHRRAFTKLADAVRPCGLQDTPPGNAAVGLAARVNALTADRWSAAIERDRSLVLVWAMRGSPIAIATDDLPIFTAGLLPDTDEATLGSVTTGLGAAVEASGVSATELVERLTQRACEILDGRIIAKQEFGELLVPAVPTPLRDRLAGIGEVARTDPLSALTLTIARLISLRGAFVIAPRHPGQEPWLVRTDQWLARMPPPVAADEARAELARRFLRAFAPANAADLAWWAHTTTGARSRAAHESRAARIWSLIRDELTEVEVEDGARSFVLTADLHRLADSLPLDGVRLLPPYDPLLMLRDRATLLPTAFHNRLWRKTNNPGAVLAGIDVVATWTMQKKGRSLRLQVTPLADKLDHRTRAQIEAEAQLLPALRGCDRVEISFG